MSFVVCFINNGFTQSKKLISLKQQYPSLNKKWNNSTVFTNTTAKEYWPHTFEIICINIYLFIITTSHLCIHTLNTFLISSKHCIKMQEWCLKKQRWSFSRRVRWCYTMSCYCKFEIWYVIHQQSKVVMSIWIYI